MKKLSILLGVIMLVFSCSNDDNEGNTVMEETQESIVGKWTLSSIIENGEDISDECDKQEFFTFNEDGTFSLQVFNTVEDLKQDGTVTVTCVEGVLDAGVYTIKGNILSITYDSEDITDDSPFSINGNTLTLNFEDNNTEIYTRE